MVLLKCALQTYAGADGYTATSFFASECVIVKEPPKSAHLSGIIVRSSSRLQDTYILVEKPMTMPKFMAPPQSELEKV